MSVEPLLLACVAAVGSSIVVHLGRRSLLDHAALAVPCGVAVLSAVGLVMFVAPVRFHATFVFALTVLIGIGLLLWTLRATEPDRRPLLVVPGLTWATIVLLTSVVARRLTRTRVTADSYEYIQGAGLFDAVGSPFGDAYLLVARQGTMALTHSLALVGGEPYLVSLAPLLAVSGLAGLLWLARLLTGRLTPRALLLVGCLTLALLTTNRVLFNTFYVNAHLLVAVYLLLLAATGWAVLRSLLPSRWVTVCCLAIATVVPARPEAVLLLALVIAPLLLLAGHHDRTTARAIVAVYVAVTWIWWVGGLGRVASWSPLGEGTVAVAAATASFGLLAVVPGSSTQRALRTLLPWAAHAVLAVAILGFAVVDDDGMLGTNLRATWSNLAGDGLWGALPLGFVIVVTIAVVAARPPGIQVFLLPITTMLPLALVLAFARDGAFRLGPGDSLNRMWMHILLVAAGSVIVSLLGTDPPTRRDVERRAGEVVDTGGVVDGG